MASETGIANAALIKLGEKAVLDINDETKSARLCKRRLPELRDKLLRNYPWFFAIIRVELAQVMTPIYEFSYAHQLPSDCMRVVEIDLKHTKYKREGNQILSNNDQVYLRYVRQIVDPNLMDAAFLECLSANLAQELCISLTDNQNLYRLMKSDYQDSLSEARHSSAIEQSGNTLLAEEWIRARFTGTAGPEGFYRE